jgi:tetratricopeptide (TPR) repeat protein
LIVALLCAGPLMAAETPSDPAQVLAAARSSGERGEYRAAVDQLTALLARPDLETAIRVKAYEERGIAHGDNADFELAIDDFTQAIRLSPRLAELYYNRARLESDIGRYQTAIEDMDTIESVGSQFDHYHYYRGYMHYENGNFNHALADLTLATREEPKNAAVFYQRGRAYDAQNLTAHAMADYAAVIALNPADQTTVLAAYRWRGTDAYGLGQHPAAISDFTALLKLSGDDPDASMRRGYANLVQGNFPAALADANKAINSKADGKTLFPWPGVVDSTHPIADRIIERYNAGLRGPGTDPYAYVLRARTQLKLGRKEPALADYRKALSLIPRGADPELASEADAVAAQ